MPKFEKQFMTFDWHLWYPLHTVIVDNSQAFRGVPSRAQLCNFPKWFFRPRFGVVAIWELWQFWDVRKGPPKSVLCCLTMAVGSLYQRLIGPHLEWIC